jgi:hypothetical protein
MLRSEISVNLDNSEQLLSSDKSENARDNDILNEDRNTKEFLDKLTDPEWLTEKRQELCDMWRRRNGEQFAQSQLEEYKRTASKEDLELPERALIQKMFEAKFLTSDEVENDDFQYKMYFKTTDQLVQWFAKLEEENLALISAQQENEEAHNEEVNKIKEMERKKNDLINAAKATKEHLERTVKGLQQRVNHLKDASPSKGKASIENNFGKIEHIILAILKEFQGEKELKFHELGIVNESECKNKENLLKYLKAIERLLIEQIAQLKESGDRENLKKEKSNAEAARRRTKEEKNNGKTAKEEENREKQRLQEQRLENLRKKKRRKDMFKSGLVDQQDEAEDKGEDEALLEYQKYFGD